MKKICIAGCRMLIAVLIGAWRELTKHKYRPEQHYMRGPGPKAMARSKY